LMVQLRAIHRDPLEDEVQPGEVKEEDGDAARSEV